MTGLFLVTVGCAHSARPTPPSVPLAVPNQLETPHDPSRSIDRTIGSLLFCPPKGCSSDEAPFERPELLQLDEPPLGVDSSDLGFEAIRVIREQHGSPTRVVTLVWSGKKLLRRDGEVEEGRRLYLKQVELPFDHLVCLRERLEWIDFWNLSTRDPSGEARRYYGFPVSYILEARCVGGYHRVTRSGRDTVVQEFCRALLEGTLCEP